MGRREGNVRTVGPVPFELASPCLCARDLAVDGGYRRSGAADERCARVNGSVCLGARAYINRSTVHGHLCDIVSMMARWVEKRPHV